MSGEAVDAITGATVSSKAVVAGVAAAVKRLREAFGEQPGRKKAISSLRHK